MDIRINLDRLKNDIEELGQIGRDKEGGVSRPSFSQADLEAREWLKDRIKSAGLTYGQDGVGNIFGRIEGEGKTIMAGSHIDSVINGGKFDGPVGVLSALEALRRIKEEGLQINKPLEVAAFTDEEGNLVGDFLGSRAFISPPDRELLEKGITQFGLPFSEVLKRTEFTVESIMEAHKHRPEIEVFLELHIEQGPVLETENIPIGIVDCIAGKNYWLGSFLGRASHAGTTPFELRQDAFLGLAELALKGTQYVATHHYGSVFTIGRVHVHPGAFTVIPGRSDFSVDFRSTSKDTLKDIKDHLIALTKDIASTRGLEFQSKIVDTSRPVQIPSGIMDSIKKSSESLGYSHMTLHSGAGHDAQILADITETGMIFIPCEDGISHSPKENIKWEDLEKGANVLLHTIIDLAS
jgi:N-carbamoyl-L-amino-acid hydrolase